MSSILNSVGELASTAYGSTCTGRGDPDETIAQVFSSLDSQGKGYVDAADFRAAFESIGLVSSETGGESLSVAGANEVMSVLDGDGDGKVTSEDMTQGLRALTDSLGVLRGREALGSMPPASEALDGLTQDALASQLADLTESGETADSDPGAALLAGILGSFDAADSNGDGRISGEEAIAFATSLDGADATLGEASATSTASAASQSDVSTELLVMRRIMALVDAYGLSESGTDTSDVLSELV